MLRSQKYLIKTTCIHSKNHHMFVRHFLSMFVVVTLMKMKFLIQLYNSKDLFNQKEYSKLLRVHWRDDQASTCTFVLTTDYK